MKQLSNVELLKIIQQEKEDSTASVQNTSDALDSQEDDFTPPAASLGAPHIPGLPQSPLTDPGLVAARIRHKAVKPLPTGDRSPFQLKLQKSPYGIYAGLWDKAWS